MSKENTGCKKPLNHPEIKCGDKITEMIYLCDDCKCGDQQ